MNGSFKFEQTLKKLGTVSADQKCSVFNFLSVINLIGNSKSSLEAEHYLFKCEKVLKINKVHCLYRINESGITGILSDLKSLGRKNTEILLMVAANFLSIGIGNRKQKVYFARDIFGKLGISKDDFLKAYIEAKVKVISTD
jgi:hypothetical protein